MSLETSTTSVKFVALLRLPFSLGCWALSFSVVGVTIASFVYAEAAASPGHRVIGLALLVVLSVIIGGLVGRTLVAVRRGQVAVPDQSIAGPQNRTASAFSAPSSRVTKAGCRQVIKAGRRDGGARCWQR